jgi:hypothetical protein
MTIGLVAVESAAADPVVKKKENPVAVVVVVLYVTARVGPELTSVALFAVQTIEPWIVRVAGKLTVTPEGMFSTSNVSEVAVVAWSPDTAGVPMAILNGLMPAHAGLLAKVTVAWLVNGPPALWIPEPVVTLSEPTAGLMVFRTVPIIVATGVVLGAVLETNPLRAAASPKVVTSKRRFLTIMWAPVSVVPVTTSIWITVCFPLGPIPKVVLKFTTRVLLASVTEKLFGVLLDTAVGSVRVAL